MIVNAAIDGHTLLQKFATRMKSGEGTCVGKPLPGVDVRTPNLEEVFLGRTDESLRGGAGTDGGRS